MVVACSSHKMANKSLLRLGKCKRENTNRVNRALNGSRYYIKQGFNAFWPFY